MNNRIKKITEKYKLREGLLVEIKRTDTWLYGAKFLIKDSVVARVNGKVLRLYESPFKSKHCNKNCFFSKDELIVLNQDTSFPSDFSFEYLLKNLKSFKKEQNFAINLLLNLINVIKKFL